MSNNDDNTETKVGTVIEALPNTEFKVKTEDGEEYHTYLSGKMRRFSIRVLVGDKVKFEVNEYGGKGRITQRL